MPASDFARHATSPRASSEKKLCRPFANTDFNSASSLSDTALLPFSRSSVKAIRKKTELPLAIALNS